MHRSFASLRMTIKLDVQEAKASAGLKSAMRGRRMRCWTRVVRGQRVEAGLAMNDRACTPGLEQRDLYTGLEHRACIRALNTGLVYGPRATRL